MKSLISAILCAAMAVYFFALALGERKRRRRFFQWAPMEAEIIAKSVKPHDHHHVQAAKEFSAAVTYRYKAKGKEYTSNRLSFDEPQIYSGKGAQQRAERFLASLPVPLRGRYDPRRPASAAIFPPDSVAYYGLIMGVTLMCFLSTVFLLLYLAG